MKKTEAIHIITKCAKLYREKLENTNILFLYGTPDTPDAMETLFLSRHFLHLTGVNPDFARVHSSRDFYTRCLSGRLSPDDFVLAEDGSTEMKLEVLPNLIRLVQSARMIGDYDQTKSLLCTEKLAGNVRGCIGFVKDGRYYVPNTALRQDIRDITTHPQKRIIAIFQKVVSQSRYGEPSFCQKELPPEGLTIPPEMKEKFRTAEFAAP